MYVICIELPHFMQIKSNTTDLRRHIGFSWWRPWNCKSTSGCEYSDGTRLRRSKSTCVPNFDEISRSVAGFGKRMSAAVEFYFRFRFWPTHRHWHGNLHRRNQFRPNRLTHIGIIILSELSYDFFSKRRPWRRKSTSGCRFSDGTPLRRWKSICIPNFDGIFRSAARLLLLFT